MQPNVHQRRRREARSELCAAALAVTTLLAVACSDAAPALYPDAATPSDSAHVFVPPAPPQVFAVAAAPLAPKKGPPYPLILVHGFFGFEKIGPFTYFHGVKAALEADGHDVHIAVLDPFNSTYVRGPQLMKVVDQVLTETGAAKVNLIAHSQGGLDSRWVASQAPQKVGAIFTIASPHLGAKLADVLLGKAPGFTVDLAKAVLGALGRPFYGDIANDTDFKASMDFMATDSVLDFNTKHPDRAGVAYYSVGGRSGLALAKDVCSAPLAPPFIKQWENDRDPVDLLLVPSWTILAGSILSPEANDGIINTASTKWGTWLGCIPADHFDEVGQLAGDSPGLGNGFDHIAFYRHVASYLRQQGF